MRAWQFVTPEGHRSRPYLSRSQAVIEAVRFSAVRTLAQLGVIAEVKDLTLHQAEPEFRDMEAEGWKVEGVK